jgi:benzoyl-CoA 2,3-dioxygenase component B
MLTEEAHHMFVGDSGIARIVDRTCQLMKQHKPEDVRRFGGIDLDTIQRYLNFHFAVSLDLFGAELSSNAATYFTAGIKGRYQETRRQDDHQLKDAAYPVLEAKGDGFVAAEQPALNTLNERLRDDYVTDCQRGVDRWNKVLERHGMSERLKLPHRAFHRRIGAFSELFVTPEGRIVTQADWQARSDRWLPTEADQGFITSLMVPATEPGHFASWIAPPLRGIEGLPLDFAYVKP